MNLAKKHDKGILIFKLPVLIVGVIAVVISVGSPLVGKTRASVSENLVPMTTRADAAALYQQRCAKCHGVDGRGDTASGRALGAPDFTDGGWRSSHGEAERKEVIAAGRKGMPAFGSKLSRQQIASLASFISAFK